MDSKQENKQTTFVYDEKAKFLGIVCKVHDGRALRGGANWVWGYKNRSIVLPNFKESGFCHENNRNQ